MTFSPSPLQKMTYLISAFFVTVALFGGGTNAAFARSPAIVYTAELQAPVEAAQHIIKGTVISCAGTECKGRKSSSSIRSVCAKLANEVGPLASFSYKGKPIDAEALAKCND